MYLPSAETVKLVTSEQVGVWIESHGNDKRSALIIKAPSNTLKAIVQGCNVKFFIGLCIDRNQKRYLATAIQIFDSIDSPYLIPGLFRLKKEKPALFTLLKNRKFVMAFFDELDSNVYAAKGRVEEELSESIRENIVPEQSYSPVDSLKTANEIIDSFVNTINPAYGTAKKYETIVYSSNIEISDIKTHLVLSQSPENSINYEINNKGEGLTQEKQLHHYINLAFQGSAIHSPQVQIGKKQRELTDIFVDYDKSSYLIESKAMAINEYGFNKSMSRKKAGIQKQVKKALGQLEGGLKAIRRNETVKKPTGELLSIPADGVLHGVVLISEFYPAWDWDELIEQIYSVHSTTNSMIHILDLNEFINILKLSRRPSIHFNYVMSERFSAFYKTGNLYIKSIDSSLPFNVD